MNTLRLTTLLTALAISAGSSANQPGTLANTTMTSGDSVAALRASLRNAAGFELVDARMTEEGVACISYRVNSERGGVTNALALVHGEKVLLSTSRSRSFERAWNSKCSGSGRAKADN